MLGGRVDSLYAELARAIDGRSAHGRSARRISVAGKGLTSLTFMALGLQHHVHACCFKTSGTTARVKGSWFVGVL